MKVLFLGLLPLIAISVVCNAQARETVSLDGVWNFATDPENRGETEKWYEPSAKLPTMPLPWLPIMTPPNLP